MKSLNTQIVMYICLGQCLIYMQIVNWNYVFIPLLQTFETLKSNPNIRFVLSVYCKISVEFGMKGGNGGGGIGRHGGRNNW